MILNLILDHIVIFLNGHLEIVSSKSNGTGICKDDGSNIKGTSTKLLQGANGSLFSSGNYTYNGHVYGKIIAYDEAGNSCVVLIQENTI